MTRRWLQWLVAIALVAALIFGLRSFLTDPVEAGWTRIERGDLVQTVEVEGLLQAVESESVGPPQVADVWDYKISFMAPEGSVITKGDPLLGFDTSSLVQQLEDKQNEAAAARKEIEKLTSALGLERESDDLKLATAEAKRRKADLKVTVPAMLEKGRVLEFAGMDRDLAVAEIEYLKSRLEAQGRSTRAALAAYENQAEAAEGRVLSMQSTVAAMNVLAPRDGTVVYVKNWRDEAKKVGDSCWRGEKILMLPDLDEMQGLGEVDEADAGTLEVGQVARLHLDAHPDIEYRASVDVIHRTVQRKSWRIPTKVWKLTLVLEETDSKRMRPGMRFRGEIETGRIADVSMIPLSAVVPTTDGPFVWVETTLGTNLVAVSLGERNADRVVVLEGLSDGQRVAAAPHRLDRDES